MRKACSLCGSKTDVAPLAMQCAATCPLCSNAFPTVVREETFDDGLEWIERENPELFDRLMEKKNRRAARCRIIRRVAVVAGVVFVALVVYVLVS